MLTSQYLNKVLLKALIIDDETDICYLLSRLLKQKNLETAFVNSLSAADKALENETAGNNFFSIITSLTA